MKVLSLSKYLLVVSFLFLTFCVSAQKGDPNLGSRNSHYITISLAGGTSGFAMMPGYGSILSEHWVLVMNFNMHVAFGLV